MPESHGEPTWAEVRRDYAIGAVVFLVAYGAGNLAGVLAERADSGPQSVGTAAGFVAALVYCRLGDWLRGAKR